MDADSQLIKGKLIVELGLNFQLNPFNYGKSDPTINKPLIADGGKSSYNHIIDSEPELVQKGLRNPDLF